MHSLGNYVFDMDFMEQTMQGVVLEATFWGGWLRAIRLVPYADGPETFARPRRCEARADPRATSGRASLGPFSR